MSTFAAAALLVLSYLAGSFPTGVLLGRWKGIDVRTVGSGNIGATNVARALGRRLGLVTLAVDLLKGLVPVLVARASGGPWWLVSAAGLLCVAGHCFSIFLGFQGGKGVATSAGVFLALAPIATLGAAAVWGIVVLATRVSSIGALSAMPTLLVLLVLRPESRGWLPLAAGIAALVLIRHKANVRRLIGGAEPRM